jgi:hypothetical protein
MTDIPDKEASAIMPKRNIAGGGPQAEEKPLKAALRA